MIRSVWVLGAGKFGLKAVERLKRMHPEIVFTVVDRIQDPPPLIITAKSVSYVRENGIEFLNRELTQSQGPDWIIPAIPVHVACEWIKCRLSSIRHVRSINLPENLVNLLPNTMQGRHGELYCSVADFICPDDCSEPYGTCTVTGRKRPYRLYDLLASIQIEPFKTVVVKSRQLTAGVGGYRPAELMNALERVQRYDAPVMLSTSCKCHGVVSAFQ